MPLIDKLVILRGDYAFVMQLLDDGEQIIGNVEKLFKLVTKVKNLQLHIKDDTFWEHTMASIFNTLVHESYYEGKQYEFLNLTNQILRKIMLSTH